MLRYRGGAEDISPGSALPRTGVSTGPHLHALEFARRHFARFVAELRQFISYPSVSSDRQRAADMANCAAWLADHLRQIGLESAQVLPTEGHPVVYAEWTGARGRPTVLIYGHYDVLAPDPIGEWRSPPFEGVIRGNDLCGRGASDDKGQLFTQVKAVEAYLRAAGTLPVNVKFLFEGEEEIDSPHLGAFLAKRRDALRADLALISDSRMLGPGRPSIAYAQRGTVRLELEVRGPSADLHSGSFGGAIYNPLQALCEIIAALHDSRGRIAIPGIYDRVRKASRAERTLMRRDGPTDQRILGDAGVERGWGEQGYNLYERTTLRPALVINGLTGGHQGAGAKAIIPARALAKLSFRLVPDQDPAEVARLFRTQIARLTPPMVRTAVRTLSGTKPAVVNPTRPEFKAAVFAYEKGFGARPAFVRSGGSMPAVGLFQKMFGIPTVLMGFGLPDDRMHAPNEKFHLPNFRQGVATAIWFLHKTGLGGYDH